MHRSSSSKTQQQNSTNKLNTTSSPTMTTWPAVLSDNKMSAADVLLSGGGGGGGVRRSSFEMEAMKRSPTFYNIDSNNGQKKNTGGGCSCAGGVRLFDPSSNLVINHYGYSGMVPVSGCDDFSIPNNPLDNFLMKIFQNECSNDESSSSSSSCGVYFFSCAAYPNVRMDLIHRVHRQDPTALVDIDRLEFAAKKCCRLITQYQSLTIPNIEKAIQIHKNKQRELTEQWHNLYHYEQRDNIANTMYSQVETYDMAIDRHQLDIYNYKQQLTILHRAVKLYHIGQHLLWHVQHNNSPPSVPQRPASTSSTGPRSHHPRQHATATTFTTTNANTATATALQTDNYSRNGPPPPQRPTFTTTGTVPLQTTITRTSDPANTNSNKAISNTPATATTAKASKKEVVDDDRFQQIFNSGLVQSIIHKKHPECRSYSTSVKAIADIFGFKTTEDVLNSFHRYGSSGKKVVSMILEKIVSPIQQLYRGGFKYNIEQLIERGILPPRARGLPKDKVLYNQSTNNLYSLLWMLCFYVELEIQEHPRLKNFTRQKKAAISPWGDSNRKYEFYDPVPGSTADLLLGGQQQPVTKKLRDEFREQFNINNYTDITLLKKGVARGFAKQLDESGYIETPFATTFLKPYIMELKDKGFLDGAYPVNCILYSKQFPDEDHILNLAVYLMLFPKEGNERKQFHPTKM